jgi:murein DD-endopeptidase MepM/ murein hydrolase activator NlpD
VRDEAGVLRLEPTPVAVDSTPLRVRGRAGAGLYWSLRSAGVEPATAQDYLRALATRVDLGGGIAPDDGFDLVIANRRAATGESLPGPLLYAGLDRAEGGSVRLLRWDGQWLDPDAAQPRPAATGMKWPVNAPITSGFGWRWHPILHFGRMHAGIDFGARWGTPIVAAADGQVVAAGWRGGYGQQVRLAHAGGLGSSYSHMSRITVAPGAAVRQGQLLGYVGSTGLATGPHLHYEVYVNGRAVDPLKVRLAPAAPPVDMAQLPALRERLKALLATARG